jgi:hypothetical protein
VLRKDERVEFKRGQIQWRNAVNVIGKILMHHSHSTSEQLFVNWKWQIMEQDDLEQDPSVPPEFGRAFLAPALFAFFAMCSAVLVLLWVRREKQRDHVMRERTRRRALALEYQERELHAMHRGMQAKTERKRETEGSSVSKTRCANKQQGSVSTLEGLERKQLNAFCKKRLDMARRTGILNFLPAPLSVSMAELAPTLRVVTLVDARREPHIARLLWSVSWYTKHVETCQRTGRASRQPRSQPFPSAISFRAVRESDNAGASSISCWPRSSPLILFLNAFSPHFSQLWRTHEPWATPALQRLVITRNSTLTQLPQSGTLRVTETEFFIITTAPHFSQYNLIYANL